MTRLATTVKRLRLEKAWTLRQLADRSGVSISHVNAIENGTRPNPSFFYVVRLAAALGVSVYDFVDDEHGAIPPQSLHSSGAHKDTVEPSFNSTSADPALSRFLASEQSIPYVQFAKEIAEHIQSDDPATLLQIIAAFLRDYQLPYQATSQTA